MPYCNKQVLSIYVCIVCVSSISKLNEPKAFWIAIPKRILEMDEIIPQ